LQLKRVTRPLFSFLPSLDSVNADPKDLEGRTPLVWTVRGGHEGVVKMLLEPDEVEVDESVIGNGRHCLALVRKAMEVL